MEQELPPVEQPTPQPVPASKNPYKMLFFVILGVFLILIAGLVYFLTKNVEQNDTAALSPTPTQASQAVTPTVNIEDEQGIPLSANTVSYASKNNDVFLQYRGKMYSYSPSETGAPVEVSVSAIKNYTWIGLVNAPANVDAFDEVFAFNKLPNNEDFVFIMRWHPDFVIYLHRDGKLTQLSKTTMGSSSQQNVPKILALSDDSRYGAFTMYPCWNCGGSKPETMLINFQTKETKRIGKTSYFAWKANGAYEFKEYVVTACPTPTGEEMMVGECSQDPATLPLKPGSM